MTLYLPDLACLPSFRLPLINLEKLSLPWTSLQGSQAAVWCGESYSEAVHVGTVQGGGLGKRNPCLAERGSCVQVWSPLLPTQPPSQASFTLRSALPQGQLLPRLCVTPPQSEDQAGPIYSSLYLRILGGREREPLNKENKRHSHCWVTTIH